MYCAEQLSLIHAQDTTFAGFYRYHPGIFPGRQEAAVPLSTRSAFTKKHFRNPMRSSSPSLGLNLPLSGPGEGGLPARFPPKRKVSPKKWAKTPSSLCRQCQDPLRGCAIQSTLQRTLKMQRQRGHWRCRGNAVGMDPRGWIRGGWGWGPRQPTWLSVSKCWSWGKALTAVFCNASVKPGFRGCRLSLLSGSCSCRWVSRWEFKIFHSPFYAAHRAPRILWWKRANVTRPHRVGVFPHPQHPSDTARRLCKAGPRPWLCFVTWHSAPTRSVFPLQHLPLTSDKYSRAEHGAGGGGGRHCQMAPRGRSSYFATRLLFPFLFFCPCHHYSAHSLLNPSSRPSSSQPVAALLVIREASQGRCMWQLWQHMVHLLLRGARRVSASRSSMCARVRARVGCRLFGCPLKQGPRLMQVVSANTVKWGFWMADNLFSEQMVPCR